ncbi:MAG: hypothetical protein AB8F74_10395 [Saprospiraceae bacterium]
MIRSRLVEILRVCNKKELRELKKWVHSPAHNLREDVILLYNYLVEDGYLWEDEFIAKSVVYPRVYPKEEYNDAKMRQVIHFLMKSVEEFLIYQEVNQDEVESKMVLSKVYRKKGLDKSFEKNMRNIKSLQQKQEYRNDHYYRSEFLRLREELAFLANQTRTKPMNLQEFSDVLDVNFIIDKLQYAYFMLSHQKVFKAEYNFGLISEVLSFIDKHPELLDISAIAVYYYGYKTVTDKRNEVYFHALKKEIFENGHLFPHEELLSLYVMAINYGIARHNAGQLEYTKESFKLYKRGFEKKILIQDGKISRFTFPNVVTVGLRSEEYDWVESFIHNYNHYLEDKYREDTVQFCLARLHFEKEEFDSALRICTQTDYDEIFMNLYSRAMVMKIYYQQNEYDVLDSYLESFRNYVVRKKNIGYHKANYKNIIRLTKKLLKVNPYSKKDKEKLKAEIEKVNPLTERSWLLEQLEKAS